MGKIIFLLKNYCKAESGDLKTFHFNFMSENKSLAGPALFSDGVFCLSLYNHPGDLASLYCTHNKYCSMDTLDLVIAKRKGIA